MDWNEAIIPAQEPPPSPPESRLNKRVFVIIGVAIALVVTSVVAWKILENRRAKSRVARESIRETATGALSFEESHPELFSASIEYDPQTGNVTQYGTGKGRGDPPPFFAEKPEPDSSRFIYKVVVVSKENSVLLNGWYSVSKESVQTSNNMILLEPVTAYVPGAIVQVSLSDGKLIWTGKIE